MERLLKKSQLEFGGVLEIANNALYFAVLKTATSTKRLKCSEEIFYFSTDEELLYHNYYSDFGPLNISCLYKYCTKLNQYLQYSRGIKKVVHYTCSHPEKKANAAFLMGSYCVIYLKMDPKHVYKLMDSMGPFKPFVDASQFFCQFNLKLLDCYQGVAKAKALNFFNFDDFNASEYDLYNKLEFGDLNWLVPRKFLAFIGPADNRTAHPPEFYIKYFLKNDVKTVIRLNNALYDSYAFVQVGIQHYDLIFPDGTTPPKNILLKFFCISETAPGAIGVHCKAGLGRTGSLIAAYLMKHYRLTAREAIAWLRICRPGSVIGQQQIWLEKIQSWLWKIGSQYRLQNYGEGDKIPRHKYGIYSQIWPIERERLIKEARKNIRTTFTKSQIDAFLQAQRKRKTNAQRLLGTGSAPLPPYPGSFKNISQLVTSEKTKKGSEKSIGRAIIELAPKKLFKKAPEKDAKAKASVVTQGDKLNEIKASRSQKNKISKGTSANKFTFH